MLELPDPSRVDAAAGQQDRQAELRKMENIPARYRNHPRFEELTNDPAHQGDKPGKVLREAMSALEAEMSGKVKSPVSRGDTSWIDFYDGEGYPFDVKTPLSPTIGDKWEFNAYGVADTILNQLHKTHPNKFTHEKQPVAVLLDTTYMKPEDLLALRHELRKKTKENRSILKRVFEVNVQLDPPTLDNEKPKANKLSVQQQALLLRQRTGR
ncbi:MAG: hypothetical protein IKR09_09520 [Alphaproteobacteria bacterium]|nr:hypothetical protein [Alphaproteobacteria bacterium]